MPEKTTQKAHGKKAAPPSEKEVQTEVVIQIPLAELHPFPDHPFQVRNDDSMRETAESVNAYGVLVPAIVRPRDEGGYEIIAGHRRKYACELAELASMPAIVRNMDRDTATIIMVDSNLQRENILPSERAKAYKMKMDAIKRQGARTDLTSPNISAKFRSDDEIGQDAGVSGDTIRNYISLTQLVPELQQIEYDCICQQHDRMQLDELVEIMLEVAMNRSPTIKIGRDAEYPTGFVQQRFEKITSMHIEKVMDGIRENTTRVWNTKAYLLAALFNSVSTIDNHYTMLVNHDLHSGL